MNSKKKNIQKTSGTRKQYKPGQLVTINNSLFRIAKRPCGKDCIACWYSSCRIYIFCHTLPIDLYIKPVSKHKG